MTVNEHAEITSCNPKFFDLFGYEKEELSGKDFNILLKDKKIKKNHKFLVKSFMDNPSKYPNLKRTRPVEVIRKDQSTTLVNIVIKHIESDNGNEALVLINDVSNEVKLEDTRKALNEREVLLKEIHHRVKNNMQVISSSISLTANKYDKAIKNSLLETKIRITAMSLVHELLYDTQNLKHIDSKTYINSLIGHIRNIQFYRSAIEINFDIDQFKIDMDTAIPLGLIINEILTNIFKYAFKSDQFGVVQIKLKQNNNKIVLTISDNGNGIENIETLKNSKSLGFKLISNLAKQLNAEMLIENNNGLSYKIALTNECSDC